MSFTLTVLRHCSSTKPADKSYAADLARQPTEKGFAQAKARGEKLRQKFDIVFSSPTDRCVKTAATVAGIDESRVVKLDELYYDGKTAQSQAIDALFNELGYVSLEDYLCSEGGEHVRTHGKIAAKAALDYVGKYTRVHEGEVLGNPPPKSILVVGHAVLSSALGLALIDGVRSPYALALRRIELNECEGYCALVEDGKIVSLEIIQDPKEQGPEFL